MLTAHSTYPIKLLGLLLLSLFLSCNETEDAKATDIANDKLYRDGVFINHKSYGAGEISLLFVHGWCIDQTYWSEQVKALSSKYKVITLDLPGFGDSGKNRENWTIEEYGKDVQFVIEQLQLENVILIGHSMGGDVILEAAMDNEEVIALIGIDTFKDAGVETDETTEAELADFMNLLKSNFSQITPIYAKQVLFHPNTDSLIQERILQSFTTADSASAIASIEGLIEYTSKEIPQLARLSQKLYLINSNATPTYEEGFKAANVDYKIIDIDATGHYPMIEKVEEFNELLLGAVERIVRD